MTPFDEVLGYTTRVLALSILIIMFVVRGAAPLGSGNSPAYARVPNLGLERAPLIHNVIYVGRGRNFAKPSDAAEIVRAGDTVVIDAGTYDDCAVWPKRAGFLTIEAAGGAAFVMGKSCENKALFVIKGDNVVVRGITFTGATAIRHNGAGIRAEGRNLTIENSQFIDNEEGILAGPIPNGRITVSDSFFKGNGNCIEACAHGIYVNKIAELRIVRCQFVAQHMGHHVKSRADRTELTGNTIEDGPFGTASYLVDIPNGGALVMRDNTLKKDHFPRTRVLRSF